MKIITGGKQPTSPYASQRNAYSRKGRDTAAVKKPVRRIKDADADDEDIKIEVVPDQRLNLLFPHQVHRIRPFVFSPRTFVPESERLNKKFIEADLQKQCLRDFLADPIEPVIYGISGNPDDMKAKYMAAFLVQAHARKLGSKANPHWLQLYYGNDSVRDSFNVNRGLPTMVVISNVTANSTPRRLEEARDLIERHAGRIPVVVVNAGEDPLSFVATKLHSPIQSLAYFCSSIVKLKEEVE